MLARWRAAGLVLPTLLTLATLPILLGLGTWQLQRKAWKEDLISKIEARRTAPPTSYADALKLAANPDDVEYLRVRVSGQFEHGQERHVYAPKPQGQGWHVYTPFRPDDGAPLVFVNRGWSPEDLKDPAKRPDGLVAGSLTVTGLARNAEQKGAFTPDNDAAGNRYYSRDLEAMRQNLTRPDDGASAASPAAFAPFSIDAEAEPANPGGWPKGGETEIRLSNAHLQYVVTWYGIALTLIGVFIAFARQRLAALDAPSRA